MQRKTNEQSEEVEGEEEDKDKSEKENGKGETEDKKEKGSIMQGKEGGVLTQDIPKTH